VKEKDNIIATDRKLLCCYGQTQRTADERRPDIKRKWVSLEEKKYMDLQGNSARRSAVDSE
jgi:hypothetical protein